MDREEDRIYGDPKLSSEERSGQIDQARAIPDPASDKRRAAEWAVVDVIRASGRGSSPGKGLIHQGRLYLAS